MEKVRTKIASFKSADEIKAAVTEGITVHWSNDGYTVTKQGDYYGILFDQNDNFCGLTWKDGKTLNGKLEEFYFWQEATPIPQVLSLFKIVANSDCGSYFGSYLQSVTVIATDKEQALALTKKWLEDNGEKFVIPEDKWQVIEVYPDLSTPAVVDHFEDSDY